MDLLLTITTPSVYSSRTKFAIYYMDVLDHANFYIDSLYSSPRFKLAILDSRIEA